MVVFPGSKNLIFCSYIVEVAIAVAIHVNERPFVVVNYLKIHQKIESTIIGPSNTYRVSMLSSNKDIEGAYLTKW